jgi:two-component system CheB/CheR fusion protein
MLNKIPNYIIAIGASAGGMEEINSFFDHTPLDGVSYIIIQHLSADFKSRMVELLAKHSKLVVKEAENGETVKSNEVYLIPNNKYMIIRGNRLFLSVKEKANGPHLTINRFFNSLAEDYGKKAIAIVLSGLGSDGTEGIRGRAGHCTKPGDHQFWQHALQRHHYRLGRFCFRTGINAHCH